MILPRKTPLFLTFLLFPYISYARAVSLSDFQSISSFSATCTAVWIASIPGCSTEDFKKGHSCSSQCIAGLQTINVVVNKACEGSQAGKDTLIGLFFQGLGVSTLCPDSNSDSPSQSTSEPETAETTSMEETTTSQSEAPTTSDQASTTRTSTSQLPQTTAAATTTSSTTAEATSAISTAPSTLSSSVTSAAETAITTAAVKPPSPTSSVSSSSSSSSSTNSIPPEATRGFGGSGNAFDILAGEGSRTERRSRKMAGIVFAAAWVAGNAWQ
ncbi:hypothetical protein DTO027B5_5789 [Paecilomyces variotii]|nr:hypothetical protein DTO169C6_6686 [Paecilomyces variotii]KAJ9253045.1 hypothetical protein DTO207G8_4346 [Paecilomyces variotii]KAJ9324167.1 hypothetical protein DTO027B3_4722 [Paecilomyces variotii]KAJ9332495.1 hypothetical protein DTO027B5_5789 [Paecilomyces variotii]KAJ9380961.1 hypothetical protein DTO063F5_6412 [Paecilomyces variotii]